jgi:hypothetical protein
MNVPAACFPAPDRMSYTLEPCNIQTLCLPALPVACLLGLHLEFEAGRPLLGNSRTPTGQHLVIFEEKPKSITFRDLALTPTIHFL